MAIPMMMRRLRLLGSFSVLGLAILLIASPGAQASGAGPAFTCQAAAANLNGQALGTAFVNVSPTCTSQMASQTTLTTPVGGGTIKATDLTASTSVTSSSVRADATLKNLNLTFVDNGKTNTILADAATSEVTGNCVNGTANLGNSTTFPNLVVNGVSNPPSPVTLQGGGTLTTNFSFTEGTGSSAGIEASALHIVSSDNKQTLDIAFTSIHANCTPGVPSTGGGPIPPTGERSPWLLWGVMLTALGLIVLSGTLVARKRWLR